MGFGSIEFGKSAETVAPVEAAIDKVDFDAETRERATKLVDAKAESHDKLDGLAGEIEMAAKLQSGAEVLPASDKVTESISFADMSGLTQVAAAQMNMTEPSMERQMQAMEAMGQFA